MNHTIFQSCILIACRTMHVHDRILQFHLQLQFSTREDTDNQSIGSEALHWIKQVYLGQFAFISFWPVVLSSCTYYSDIWIYNSQAALQKKQHDVKSIGILWVGEFYSCPSNSCIKLEKRQHKNETTQVELVHL